MDVEDLSLFEQIGGRPLLDKVHKLFYDKVYAHPWIGQFFKDVKQEHIENQQSDFMAQAMGGPKKYAGKLPIPAHKHLFITPELFDLRTQLLVESLNEAGVSEEHQARWMKIDQAFKNALIKKSPNECEQRYADEPITIIPNPDEYKKSA